MALGDDYKLVKKEGVTAVIVHDKSVLLLKRPLIPFISNPGIWSFVSGGLHNKEKANTGVYREIEEETKLHKLNLKLISGPKRVKIVDVIYKKKTWYDSFYVFRSDTAAITLNYESRSYRWAKFSEIINEEGYRNIFADKNVIQNMIKSAIDKQK